jgi:AcrR family transcriptional regulator
VRDWVPVPGSTKARLVQRALAEFGSRGYADVGVNELAAGAGVTIGSLYHHFGSKTGLYAAVRADVEQRLLDRMEGAAAVRPVAVGAVLLVGFDYLVSAGFARLLGEERPEGGPDRVEEFVAAVADRDGLPIGRLLLATWRTALIVAAEAQSNGGEVTRVRGALAYLTGEAASGDDERSNVRG